MIQGVTFDLDGVYFPNGKQHFIQALARLGVSDIEARRVFLHSEEMNHRYKHGLMTDQEFWQWAANQWQLDLSPTDLTSLLIGGYDINVDVAQTVRNLRTQGIKTLICSNNFPARVDGLQKKYHFLDDFDTAIFSYQVGTSKPDEKIYSALVEKSGLPAESIVFADDDAQSLTGAKAVGITTLVYSTYEQFIIDLKKLGLPV